MAFLQEFFPDIFTMLLTLTVVAGLALWISWILQMGIVRGSLALMCRALWVAPIFLSFFPENMTEQLPRALTLKPVHVLVDDSVSMATPERQESVGALLETLDSECLRLGCLPKVTRLSEQDSETKAGYSPLRGVLDAWLYKVGSDPWVMISDGADAQPTEAWPAGIRGMGRPAAAGQEPRGLIVGFAPRVTRNVWIKTASVPSFSFEDKPLVVDVELRRASKEPGPDRVQLQVLTGTTPIATINAEFAPEDTATQVSVTIPPLPRGQHLLTVRALPTAGETTLWDNTALAQVEVLPNTVGVLHLLGSPSWDGRFLRRYLKSEPKYDLISFFILRDPWDSQQANERELSLIPFPVERLFREELPNFRVVVIQNFTLFQFLLPEYQANLVRFVQDGGGLLFVGGPRALTAADLSSSPLRDILPFDVPGGAGGTELTMPFMDIDGLPDADGDAPVASEGPAYDPQLPFTVQLAQPDPAKRALANVYEDWEGLAGAFGQWKTAKGLHHMERMTFKKDTTTTLLEAKTAAGTVPLAVASYPGKGRALWLFSDALWRLGVTVDGGTSRQVYNTFMASAMTWLMRQDLRQPLVAKNLSLHNSHRSAAAWSVLLQGPAAKYFQPSPEWRVTICGRAMASEQLVVSKHSDTEAELGGPLPLELAGGERCMLAVEGTHPAFGSLKASITAMSPQVYKDSELDAAPQKLEDLAQLAGAALSLPPAVSTQRLQEWLGSAAGQDGVALPDRFKTLRNFYWILDRPWFWALLLLLPLEVIIRRWNQLFGARRGQGR